MKLYFEVKERTKEEEEEKKFVQIEVSSKEEAVEKAKQYSKEKYLTRLHYCYNDEAKARPCMIEEI